MNGGLIADSARVVGARLLHSQHHIAVMYSASAVGTLQMHRSLGSNPWKPALSFWASMRCQSLVPIVLVSRWATYTHESLLCCCGPPQTGRPSCSGRGSLSSPVLGTTGKPSTNDPLQPTRCIRMQGGELAGTWPGALRPRVCKVLHYTTGPCGGESKKESEYLGNQSSESSAGVCSNRWLWSSTGENGNSAGAPPSPKEGAVGLYLSSPARPPRSLP